MKSEKELAWEKYRKNKTYSDRGDVWETFTAGFYAGQIDAIKMLVEQAKTIEKLNDELENIKDTPQYLKAIELEKEVERLGHVVTILKGACELLLKESWDMLKEDVEKYLEIKLNEVNEMDKGILK